MSARSALFTLSMAVGLMLPVFGQEPANFDEATIKQHENKRVEPIYPPIAKAAHVQGTVELEITITPEGKVVKIKVVSGPAMLQQAALDSLKQWTFHPFERDGVPTSAVGKVSVTFDLGGDKTTDKKDEEVASRFFPLSDQCHRALAKQDNSPEAGEICKQAAELAATFDTGGRFIERRSAFVYAAWALGNCHKFDDAYKYAEQAVEVVQLGHDDNSGNSAAYGVRGIIEGDLNRIEDADRDLTTAEDFQRKAIEWGKSEKFEHLDSYENSMAMYLGLHAQLLSALNKPDEAKKKLQERDALRSNP